MSDLPPLFIPLKAQYFDQFESGEKDAEFRAHGPRWNSGTCPAGRLVTLSRGYGKVKRLSAKISSAEVDPYPSQDFIDIYGSDAVCWRINLYDIRPMT